MFPPGRERWGIDVKWDADEFEGSGLVRDAAVTSKTMLDPVEAASGEWAHLLSFMVLRSMVG